MIFAAFALDPDLEIGGQGINHRYTDAMQAAGKLVVLVGKLSFDAEKLTENAQAIVDAIVKARPSATKGTYVVSCSVSSTMSPGLKIDLKDLA